MEQRPKQYIVMRKDLKMRKGKMIAQGAHASQKCLLKNSTVVNHILEIDFNLLPATEAWLKDKFTKICVGCGSEEELQTIHDMAEEMGLPCAMVNDAGLTEFGGVETKTCCAIGPAFPDDFHGMMDSFKLL